MGARSPHRYTARPMSDSTSTLLPPELARACGLRQQRLQALFQRTGIDGLRISCEKDIQYLTGFVGHESLGMVTASQALIVSDSRYDEYLQPWREMKAAEVVMGTRHRLLDSVRRLCEQGRVQ